MTTFGIYLIALTAIGGAVAIGLWASHAPLAVDLPPASTIHRIADDTTDNVPAERTGSRPRATPTLRNLRLNQPLFDPPPPVPPEVPPVPTPEVAPPPKPLPIRVRIAGIFIEPTKRTVMFIGPDNQIETRSIGQTIDGAEVVAIESDHVMLRQQKRDVRLEVQP